MRKAPNALMANAILINVHFEFNKIRTKMQKIKD